MGEILPNQTPYLIVYATVAESGPYTTAASITASNRPDPNATNDVAPTITLVPQP